MASPADPSWASPALLTGGIAALGYVGKTVAELVLQLRGTALERRSRLVELYALLRAGDAAYAAQRRLLKRLAVRLRRRVPDAAGLPPGFDRLLLETYTVMNEEERQLHGLIRAMTMHTFRPLNQSLLEWLRADRYFRAAPPSHRRLGKLALFLAELEAHLVIWVAKYEAWIPDQPDHALVYLADESKHGVAFPRHGAAILARVLHHPAPQRRWPNWKSTAGFPHHIKRSRPKYANRTHT